MTKWVTWKQEESYRRGKFGVGPFQVLDEDDLYYFIEVPAWSGHNPNPFFKKRFDVVEIELQELDSFL